MARIFAVLVLFSGVAYAQAPGSPAEPKAAESPKVTEQGNTALSTPSSADDAYKVKLNDLQGRVNELKEKIFRTKTRLAILKESILSTSIAGAEAQLIHRNEMGASFNLEKIIYSLDGTPIKTKIDKDGDLADQKEIQIFDGPIVPGNHTISVVMIYRGNGFGIFSYLRGYVFTLRSSHTFHAEEGKRVQVKIIGYEKGGMTTDLRDKPDIRFERTLAEAKQSASDKVDSK
ncbi:MAG: dihydrolipoamide acetyltransferase [Myxococcota bacterium]|nr:dihydrolipoamide acetyltransferase [Myxococcota bacterium]